MIRLAIIALVGLAAFITSPVHSWVAGKVVNAWARRTLSGLDAWAVLRFDLNGVAMANPAGLVPGKHGLQTIEVRDEFIRPERVADGRALSIWSLWAIDCERKVYAVLDMRVYSGNNLAGQYASRSTPEPVWHLPNTMSRPVMRKLCEASRTRRTLPAGLR